jgi:hypothetical protein
VPNLAVEFHFASLNARSEERALAHLDNPSRHAPAIQMDKASYADSVTDFHLRHGSTLSNKL